jgi:type II secretory pathway component PulK
MCSPEPGARRGFALPAVLWVIVGVATLGAGLSLVAREAVASAQNRVNLARAAWQAEGCLERARAAAGAAMSEPTAADAGWRLLDRVVASSALTVGCDLTLGAAGAALDVNTAGAEELRGALIGVGVPHGRADSLVDALLDWRDPDNVPRRYGAERSWYQRDGRSLPRNGPLAAQAELRRVRGLDSLPGLDSLFGVEPGRVVLGRAPLAVVLALPGMSPEVAGRIAERAARGDGVDDLLGLGFGSVLSTEARDAVAERYADLVRLATGTPDAWIVSSRAAVGTPPVMATLETRLVRAGARAAILRRRSWP